MIEVMSAGALTTVQDLGRPGYGSIGVPPSGAFDAFALRVANLLVGNEQGAAGLECTLRGPTLRFERDSVIALTGASFAATIDDRPFPLNHSQVARAGAKLSIGASEEGARCYLAVRGGIAADPVLGSRSTHVAAELGPSRLRPGDGLRVGEARPGPMRRARTFERAPSVRAVPLAASALFDDAFSVSTQADRTGVRLEGTVLRGRQVDPRAMPEGAIQVPPDGVPIVLGPDRPITGGYESAAWVIAADLGVIAQAKPGDTIRFVRATIEDARAAWLERERGLLDAIEDIG